jgi:hypothetical protein
MNDVHEPDNWNELASEFGLEPPAGETAEHPPATDNGEPPASVAPQPATEEPPSRGRGRRRGGPERAEAPALAEPADGFAAGLMEEPAAEAEKTADEKPDRPRRRGRGRSRRRKDEDAAAESPAAESGTEVEAEAPAELDTDIEALTEDDAEDESEVAPGPEPDAGLSAELVETLANWDVPTWNEIVAGLHRPER